MLILRRNLDLFVCDRDGDSWRAVTSWQYSPSSCARTGCKGAVKSEHFSHQLANRYVYERQPPSSTHTPCYSALGEAGKTRDLSVTFYRD